LGRELGGGLVGAGGVLLCGPRGAGKSRLAYRWAARARCLVVHPELSREVAADLARSTGSQMANVHLLEELEGWQAEADRLEARAVVLDSLAAAPDPVSELRAAQRWARGARTRIVFALAHATKGGDHRGSSDLAHWADTELRITRGEVAGEAGVKIMKTRGGPSGGLVAVRLVY